MNSQVLESPSRSHTAAGRQFRTILVHVQPDELARPRLATAAALAASLGARLVGVAAEDVNWAIVNDPTGIYTAAQVDALRELIAANLARSRVAFDAATGAIDSEFISFEGDPVRTVCAASRMADLIVAGGSPLKHPDRHQWCDPAELALKSGLPVLLAPPGGGPLLARSIVVAWKDTREARRALHDALPFLAAAERVQVVEICKDDEVGAAEHHTEQVLANLAQHGIEATRRVIASEWANVGVALQGAARLAGADLIVAGAYGHSRLGEWAFGGVTHDLLHDPKSFVLFSH